MIAIVVVPNDLLAVASAAVQQVYPQNTGEVFTRQLSANGQLPGTHWLTAPVVDGQVEQALRYMATLPQFASCSLDFCEVDVALETQQALFSRLGLQLIEGE